jgi:hypothetical protein
LQRLSQKSVAWQAALKPPQHKTMKVLQKKVAKAPQKKIEKAPLLRKVA